METGFICTAYFKGIDGLGKCDDCCQWWSKEYECPCAKGSKNYDGLDDSNVRLNNTL